MGYRLSISPDSAEALRDAAEIAQLTAPKAVRDAMTSLTRRVLRAENHHDIYFSPLTKAYEIEITKAEYDAAVEAQQTADKLLGRGTVQFGPKRIA